MRTTIRCADDIDFRSLPIYVADFSFIKICALEKSLRDERLPIRHTLPAAP